MANDVARLINYVIDINEPLETKHLRGIFQKTDKLANSIKITIKENGKDVIAIGKIGDLFTKRGITKEIHTKGNEDGIQKTIEEIKLNTEGLIFTNLVDFDMLYGNNERN